MGIGYAHLLNVPARFHGLGGNPAALPLPPGGTSGFGEYDDGYVRVDISGDTTLTSNWGYSDYNRQFDPANGGSLALSVTQGIAGGGSSQTTENAPGFELFVLREMGRVEFNQTVLPWGFSSRLHYARFDVEDSGSVPLNARRITDRFALNGVIPPLAPYNGSFTGPGALISTAASRTESIVPGGSTSRGMRQLEVDLVSSSFGAWIEIPFSDRRSLELEGGISLAIADGNYAHQSEVTGPGGVLGTTRDQADRTSFLPGFHVGLAATYGLTERWDLLISGRYQYLDDFAIRAGSSAAELSFSHSFVLTTGVRFRF